jgi:hypothetical protein
MVAVRQIYLSKNELIEATMEKITFALELNSRPPLFLLEITLKSYPFRRHNFHSDIALRSIRTLPVDLFSKFKNNFINASANKKYCILLFH